MTAANVAHLPEPKPQRKTKKKKASVAAQEAEADDGFVTLEQCGVTLRIPVGGKTPLAAIDAYLVGDEYEGNKALLGEKQWAALCAAGATMDDLDEVGTKLKEASGN